ncbi:MAG: hypothetical protein Q8R15_00875, partial [Candidatus Micrarchaeota archaeon]|nr:hypothetical protein [Candidatus Micrarchaeota archaeon]
MARSPIHRLAEQIPEHGLLLHGTLASNVSDIAENGLVPSKRYLLPIPRVWFVAIPPRELALKMQPRELFKRTLASAVDASRYATQHFSKDNLPAVIISRANRNQALKSKLWLATEYVFGRPYPENFHHQTAFKIPRDRVMETVQVTATEFDKIRARYSSEFDVGIRAAVRDLLARKILKALKEVIERGSKLE